MAIEESGSGLWYTEDGRGDPFVLLHPGGAGVDSRALGPQVEEFRRRFRVLTPEQRGHGRTPDADGPLGFDRMAADTIRFIERRAGGPVHLLGVSDGAIVALTVALTRPDLVRKLVFAAAVFHRSGWHDGVLQGDPPDFLRESYAELSPDGADHYTTVVGKLVDLHSREPSFTREDLANLAVPTLILVADDDEVRFEHVLEMYDAIPDAELAVVPGTSHGLLVEKPELCNRIIADFLERDPVPTLAPIRRSPGRPASAG